MTETFSSNKERELLALASRRNVYALVKQFSGCNFHELERRTTLASSTLQYHLHYLTKHRLITMQKDGNKVRYFSQHLPSQDKQLLSLLRQETIRPLLLFMLHHKKVRQKELADFLQLSQSTVSWYLKKLVDKQVLSTTTKTGELYYSLAIPEQEIISLLTTYKTSFFDRLVDQTIEMWEFR